MMPRIPWKNEAPRYEQISNDDGRRYPYFPNQAVASPRRSPKNYSSTLELGESEPVSPLRFGESTSSLLADDAPLVPPIVQEKPCRPRLKRSSSINRRLVRSRSSEAPVRRRRSKDMELQKTAILQSIEQRGPDEIDQPTKPRRRKSLEESQELLGFCKGDPVSEKSSSTDSTMHTTRLHDGNHRHHRKMTRLRRSQSPLSKTEKSLHNQRSCDSRSPSRERKGDLRPRSHRSLELRPSDGRRGDLDSIMNGQRRRQKRRSESDLQSLKTMSISVEGTDGCCIIRPNYRGFGEMRRSFELRNPSKVSPPAQPGQNRSQSHKRLELKMAKLEEFKKQSGHRDKSPDTSFAKFKINPPSSSRKHKEEISQTCNQVEKRHRQRSPDTSFAKFKINPPAASSRKFKKEISEICNQADQRHRQRYSPKRVDSSSSDDEDD